MQIFLNGEDRQFEPNMQLDALIAELAIQTEGMAVLINERVVLPTDFAKTPLSEGDKVEIIRMVGGG